jgi:uncharacterized protein (TIGR03437 family)
VLREAYLLAFFALPFPSIAGSRPEEYALILRDPPLARQVKSRAGLYAADAARQLASIEVAQQNLRRELTHVAVDLINLPAAWSSIRPGGMANAGAGVKIAILDSGIDETHAAFQNGSLQMPPNFPKGDKAYTNNKIIVARSYESMFYRPDDTTPRDRSGHGTALAMIAAGETNTAPIATITGVAPQAWLGNYKIFGTPGVNDTSSNAAAIQALEDALSDGMDIALMAFGSPALNSPTLTDPTCLNSGVPSAYQNACDVPALAVENAVGLGMTVVVSAGNDGDSGLQVPDLNSIDSPGTAPSAITVGASTNAHVLYAAVHVQGSNVPLALQMLDALVGDGRKLQGPLSGPLADASSADATACSAFPANSFAGAVVLIARGGTCDFSTKINDAQQAGALGVILYQDSQHSSDPPFSSLGAQNTGIPAMMIDHSDGIALENYLASGAQAQVTLDPTLHAEPAPAALPANVVTGFSSRGPSIDYAIKPELVAVGQGLYTATESLDPTGDLYDPTGYTTVEGSSFAAAMVSGAAALVKQTHPTFTPGQIKSALVNTAANDATAISDPSSGSPLIHSVGGGKLNAAAALAPGGATVEPATVSFGAWSGQNPSPASLTLTNIGTTQATFTVSYSPDPSDLDPDTSDTITISPTSVLLAPGAAPTEPQITISLTGNFSVPGSYDGSINVTGPNTNLHVPYWYLVSDGTPFDILPVYDSSFYATAGDNCWYLAFKTVDRYGIAVQNQAAAFAFGQNGASQSTASSCPEGVSPGPSGTTHDYGIAWTNVDLGTFVGNQLFAGSVAGLSTYFYATVRPTASISTVKDSASFQADKGFAPGSYVTIFGTALSDATQYLSTDFLPFSMSGVSVSFYSADGTKSWPGRVSYVSPTQINVQIPWELQGQTNAALNVNLADMSVPYTIPIADSLPAMFLYGDDLAIAQDNTTYQLITASSPAQRAHYIIIYANGLGAVHNQPPSGEASPSEQLANTVAQPTVTIGGVNAPVLFSGLTPGSIGLYQIDVQVPPNAPTGLQPVVIQQGAVTSPPASLPVQ